LKKRVKEKGSTSLPKPYEKEKVAGKLKTLGRPGRWKRK